MDIVEVSTSYNYEYDGEYIRFFIGKVEGVPLIEIYSGNVLIYYKPLADIESSVPDKELIGYVVRSLRTSKARWFEATSCQWLSENFENLTYKERTTVYKFTINERIQRVFVTENYKNHARVHLLNDDNADKLNIDFDIKEGDNILRACAEYVSILDIIIKVFKENESEIMQPTLQKNMFM